MTATAAVLTQAGRDLFADAHRLSLEIEETQRARIKVAGELAILRRQYRQGRSEFVQRDILRQQTQIQLHDCQQRALERDFDLLYARIERDTAMLSLRRVGGQL